MPSGPQHEVFYSYAEYVALESSSETKHEYLAGQIYAMAGGTAEHAALAAAVNGLLFAQLVGGKCRAYSSDVRIRTASDLTTYPDLAVVCGGVEHDETELQAVTNPALLVEVLSPSTERYDRGAKFEHYKSIRALQQYVLVSHRERAIQVWTRSGEGWTSIISRDGDAADLASIGAKLDVSEVYTAAGVT